MKCRQEPVQWIQGRKGLQKPVQQLIQCRKGRQEPVQWIQGRNSRQ